MKHHRFEQTTWRVRTIVTLMGALLLGCGESEPESTLEVTAVEPASGKKAEAETLPDAIQQHLTGTLGMGEADITQLEHERMPEGLIWGVVDKRVSMCFVYVQSDSAWQNAFMGPSIPVGWRPEQTGAGFMSIEADLHSLNVWVKENCRPQ